MENTIRHRAARIVADNSRIRRRLPRLTRFAAAIGLIAEIKTLDEDPSDDPPLGACEHCAADYYDGEEAEWHEAAECIGGMERFDPRNQHDTWEEWRGER